MNDAKKIFNKGLNFYKNKNLEAAIDTWSSITRGDDKEAYALSRFNLGNLYQETNEKDEAIKAWSSITREDDKEAYAWSRFNLGNLYKETNDKDEAIKAWSSITREDDKEAYAMSRFNLGALYKNNNENKKAIETWSSITREDDKEAYARSRFNLGNLYKETNEKDEAIKAWSSITREDDKQIFARSRFYLGKLYKETNKKDEAIKAWSSITREDDKKIFARSRFYLGKLNKETNKKDEAIKAWSSITRKDDKEAYAVSRFYLGDLYKNNNENKKAIETWSSITRKDDKEAYAMSLFYLGDLYKNNNENKKAIETWSSITRKDDKKAYAVSRFYLGNLYKETNEKDEAIRAWKNINCDDYQEAYIRAQFYLGKLYQENKKYKKAKKCYKNVIKLGNSAFIYQANILLRVLEISSSNNKKNLKDLFEKIDSILQNLFVYPNRGLADCSEVAHYTRASTALLLLERDKEKVSHFRLNSIRGVNDPKEGVLLSEYLNLDNLSEQREFISFISCFTFNHDSLNQFRLYGKENNREASGVSLVFYVNKFFSSEYLDRFSSFLTLNKNLEARNDIPEENKLLLYRCIYIDPKSNYLSIAKRSKITFFRQYKDGRNEWKKYKIALKNIEDKVREEFESIKETVKEIDASDDIVKGLLHDILMPLQYLVKHYAFEEEQECRMVSIRSLTKDQRINVDEQFNSMYIEYPISVRDAVEKVYLSIGARDKEHFFIRKLGDHRKVVLSENPFRQK
ncbi:tetratricopeptide repeat protein [Avibacterium sp. 20-15]|uniref:tetratricopeptide repeat protein n=1 Tax=unclassified Avibacterium TaxID=2685287 RepID=UPI002026551C|nr:MULTISPECIES: tetratricopeptide repeat protein [unclassified Avibacterium]MCW9732396.1 tetratricopeptide repeat protein [Avibacterium sp. 20-15]URL04562.1 tetratricopeptide repeat protein [Avibacterium sp. 20-132]